MILAWFGPAQAGEVELEGSAGLAWAASVGEDSALTRLDPVASSGVRLVHTGLSAELRLPPATLELRLEEGQAHAGAVELAEALLELGPRWGGAFLGRGELPTTPDRRVEAAEWLFSTRPLLSRSGLPTHPGEVGLWIAWPDRADLRGGLAWRSPNADAPLRWAALDLEPWATNWQPRAGGAWGNEQSEVLGSFALVAADVAVEGPPLCISLAWLELRAQAPGEEELRQRSLVAELAGRAGWGDQSAALALRAEQVERPLPGEDRRRLGALRLSWFVNGEQVEIFAEGQLSSEQGSAAAGQDVLVLDDSIERDNHLLSIGAVLRPPTWAGGGL